MSLELDIASLKRCRDPWLNEVRFALRGEFGGFEPDLHFLGDRTHRVQNQLEASGNPVRVSQWLLTAAGWSGVLLNAVKFDDALEWLELFAAGNWSHVSQGRLIGGPRSRGPNIGTLLSEPTALVAYGTGDLTTIPSDDRGPLWFVEDKITRYLAEKAQAWTYLRGGRHYLGRGSNWSVELAGFDNEGAIAQAIDRYPHVELTGSLRAPTRLRNAIYWPQGAAIYQDCDSTQGWAEKVQRLRTVLLWTPPHTNFALIKTLPGNLPVWPDEIPSWPHIMESDIRSNMPLLACMVPDAAGIQLVTDAHLDRAHDLSDWSITKLPGGRHLVEARDLAAWYGDLTPDSETLTKARADFGQMIMTPELIGANSPCG